MNGGSKFCFALGGAVILGVLVFSLYLGSGFVKEFRPVILSLGVAAFGLVFLGWGIHGLASELNQEVGEKASSLAPLRTNQAYQGSYQMRRERRSR